MRPSATTTSGNAADPVKGRVGPGPTGGVVTLVPLTVTVVVDDDDDGCCTELTGTVSVVVVLDGTLPVTTGAVTIGTVVDVGTAVVDVGALVAGAAVDVVTMPGPAGNVVLVEVVLTQYEPVVVVSHGVVVVDDHRGFEVVAPALDAPSSANASTKHPTSIDTTPASRATPALSYLPSTRPVSSTRMCASP